MYLQTLFEEIFVLIIKLIKRLQTAFYLQSVYLL